MFRFVSIWQRKQRFAKDEKKQLALFYNYKKWIAALPSCQKQDKKILIIRLDDIGDYLLFRNTLPAYKQSDRWKDYSITLLGNVAWKELFDLLDKDTTDNAIWINKNEYLHTDEYKYNLWRQLRNEGFEFVICPSATRPPLLDDLCMLATGAETAIGFSNITWHQQLKIESDKLYLQLYKPEKIVHEFFLNQQFANWCCAVDMHLARPYITAKKTPAEKYILCFIGASTKSRRWPQKRWIQLAALLHKNIAVHLKIVGVAQHKEEAIRIASKTKAESITNTSLADMIDIVNNATVVVSNDTMAAHLAVSCEVPVVIISSGNNFTRFTIYEETGITGVRAVYPDVIKQKRKLHRDEALHHHIVSTSDIASIQAITVYNALLSLL